MMLHKNWELPSSTSNKPSTISSSPNPERSKPTKPQQLYEPKPQSYLLKILPAPTFSVVAFNKPTPLLPVVPQSVDLLNLPINYLQETPLFSEAAPLESDRYPKEMLSPILDILRTDMFIALLTKKHYDPSIYAILSDSFILLHHSTFKIIRLSMSVKINNNNIFLYQLIFSSAYKCYRL